MKKRAMAAQNKLLNALNSIDPLYADEKALAKIKRDCKSVYLPNLKLIETFVKEIRSCHQRILDGDDPIGSNSWYWTTYLETPALRRRHLFLRIASSGIG